ncbi:hypothetical protein ABVT39_004626 [Epinephelus coioides]
MLPKKALSAEEADKIKKFLDFLSEEVSAVRLQQKSIMDLVMEVKALRTENAEDKQIAHLERRVTDLEQYTRMNDVIITGLHVKPGSYARAVSVENGGNPPTWTSALQSNKWLPSCRIKGSC